MDTFPARLAAIIDNSGLGRPEFAARVGVGTSALAKWLSGKLTPKSDQLLSLAIAGGVSMEWLLTGKGPKSLGMVDLRKRLLLLALTINTITDKLQPDVFHRLNDAICLMKADNLEIHQMALPEDPFYVSARDLIKFAERFRSADQEGKLNLLEADRKIAENDPDVLSTFESLLSEHIEAITDPERARLVKERADQIVSTRL
jgi:transcriptional regulator with XRE-family HTH domain